MIPQKENKSVNKEDILKRMYDHAVRFWNISSVDALDPAIQMLIQGIASEIYDVHNNLENIKVRILENLANTLTPDAYTSPRPAHSIMQAYPVEPEMTIDDQTSFFLEKTTPELTQKGFRKIDFAPVGEFKLIRGNIKYSVCERILFKHDGGLGKTQLSRTNVLTEETNNTVWVAFDVDETIENLKDISFYIDFPTSANREDCLSLSPYNRWEFEGREIKTRPGYSQNEEEETGTSIFQKYALQHTSEKHILRHYRKRFTTVAEDVPLRADLKKQFPERLKKLFDESVYTSLESCYWMKIRFPAAVSANDLYHSIVCLNAFPAANKNLCSNIHKPSDLTGIIPLRTGPGESFLSIREVSDTSGNIYEYIPYKTGTPATGTYNVKQGGIERFDNRDARNMIDYLTDLMRNEVSAFSGMETEYLGGVVRKLKEGLVSLEAKTRNRPDTGERFYLLLNRIEKGDTVFYSYWTTDCEAPNGLAPGKSFLPYNSTVIEKGSCRLLSGVSGGKSAPDVTERLDAFKFSLTSRDTIATEEDICNFCRYELGNRILNVTIKKGITVSKKPKEGLVRTIDIFLKASEYYKENVKELTSELKTMLEERSPESFNYRFFVE